VATANAGIGAGEEGVAVPIATAGEDRCGGRCFRKRPEHVDMLNAQSKSQLL